MVFASLKRVKNVVFGVKHLQEHMKRSIAFFINTKMAHNPLKGKTPAEGHVQTGSDTMANRRRVVLL